jgi:hypothetical protein
LTANFAIYLLPFVQKNSVFINLFYLQESSLASVVVDEQTFFLDVAFNLFVIIGANIKLWISMNEGFHSLKQLDISICDLLNYDKSLNNDCVYLLSFRCLQPFSK